MVSPTATQTVKPHERQHAPTLKCKILLPKFNTWKQGQIERKKGFEVSLRSIVDWFFAKNHCRYGAIASPLHRNRNAISP